jgi:hypothetical protein
MVYTISNLREGTIMKKKIWITIAAALVFVVSVEAYAAVKCVPDGRGGMCCWNINTDGPFKPIGC